jgi:hypothetical protein
MNRVDAYELLMAEFAPYRELPYEELAKFIGRPSSRLVHAKSAVDYTIDVNVRWCNQEFSSILVEGMAAVAGTGPLQRIDESFVVSRP